MDRQEEDYYAILQVPQYATLERIREAYRRLALQCHPDKCRGAHGERDVVRATEEFQKLGRAWETLKDAARRAEYDRTYIEATRGFGEWTPPNTESGKTNLSSTQRQQAREWKLSAKQDYLARLEKLNEFWIQQIPQIRKYKAVIQNHELQLAVRQRETDDEVVLMFRAAIARSQQPVAQHDTILARLLDARLASITRLEQNLYMARTEYGRLVQELQDSWRRYEKEEARARETRVAEALDILGPRELTPWVDSLGRAINHWKALARVKTSRKLSICHIDRPWHQNGHWERLSEEVICGRCDQAAFHIIPECGPAKCPGCGMVICNNCFRELALLREHVEWLMDERPSLFDLEFEAEDGGESTRQGSKDVGAFTTSYWFGG